MDEAAFFDKLAPSWDENECLSTPEKVKEILGYIDILEGQSILDLGTGTGVLLPFIAEKVGEKGEITAVDYSKGMLEIARKKFSDINPKPKFLYLDFENETIPGEFDHILLYCVYPHLHTPIDTLKWLKKVNLKENGSIIVAFPCGPDYINNIHREKHSESDSLPTASELSGYFSSQGLNSEVLAENENAYVVKIS